MALMGLIYRDQLFPRQTFRDLFYLMLELTSDRQACRMLVDILALAHDRGCEAELAACIEQDVRQKKLPDMAVLRARFAPRADDLPHVEVHLIELATYNSLLSATPTARGAAA